MSVFRDFFAVKQKPLFTGLKFGFGSGGGGGSGLPPSGISATGGTTSTPGNGYKYHFFTSSGSLVVSAVGTGQVDYLVIGGGGSGGDGPNSGDYQAAGGGGAGAFLTGPTNLSAATYPVTIGAGGAEGSGNKPANSGGQGRDGGDSSFNPPGGNGVSALTAPGGGAGGGGTNHPPQYPGTAGGSSGGHGGYAPAGQNQNVTAEGAPYPGSGDTFPSPPSGWGGDGHGSYGSCGGGGGGASNASSRQPPAGEAPAPDLPTSPYTRISGQDGFAAFNGDTGIPPSYGTPGPGPGRYFAAGGGGGLDETGPGLIPGSDGGVGGHGGGGAGGSGGPHGNPVPGPASDNRPGRDATANTGSGGGGCGRDNYPGDVANGHGGAGAAGIVIIRYVP